MLNSIAQTQNTPKQILRLAAQRRLYSRAKIIFTIRTALSLTIAIGGALVASFWPDLRSIVVLVALPFSFLDSVFIDMFQKRWISWAAKIQESFDTEVLGLRWVSINYGRPIDEEEVIELGTKAMANQNKSAVLQNWYPPEVQKLPLHLGRLVCQRANSVWDKRLRQCYADIVLLILIVVALVTLGIGLWSDRSMEQFVLAVVVPLAPGILLGVRHFQGLRESNQILEKLSSDLEGAWQQALKNPTDEAFATQAARDIQNQLFAHRKSGQVIFDWLYKILRPGNEQAMKKKATDLVDDAEAQLEALRGMKNEN